MKQFTARRTPVHKGPAAWSAILPGQPAPVPLAGNHSVDVAIVGGGFAGLSAARRLRQLDPSLKVAVLEASRLAEGASGRNSGFMIDLPHDLTSDDYAGHGDDRGMIALNRHAIAFARGAVEDYGIIRDYFDPVGKVNGAASDTADALNRSYADHLTRLGEPNERLDAQGMFQLTGSRHYVSGLYTPGTVMLQPAGFVRGFGEGLRASGVGVWENSAVTAIHGGAAGWTLTTPKGIVSAAKVILANNGHLESFGFKQGRLMHIMLNACMTEELTPGALRALGGHETWGLTPADPMGTTVRRVSMAQGGNRIVIRSGGYYRPNMQTTAQDLARLVRNMRAKFDARFPMLKTVAFEYTWSGHLCLSKNGVSVLRELEPGLHAACVQNGLGTARGTLTGIGAAELACGQTSAITDFFTAQAEPVRLPPHPFDTIGANVYMRWKEWQARLE